MNSPYLRYVSLIIGEHLNSELSILKVYSADHLYHWVAHFSLKVL